MISFGVLPHKGHFLESDVPQAALAFNNPLHLRYMDHGSRMLRAGSEVFRLEGRGARNVFLDTAKRGDDDAFGFTPRQSKSVIVRLYEAFGGTTTLDLITYVFSLSFPLFSCTFFLFWSRMTWDISFVSSFPIGLGVGNTGLYPFVRRLW